MSKQEEYIRTMEKIHDELPPYQTRDIGLGIQIKHMLLTLSRQIVELKKDEEDQGFLRYHALAKEIGVDDPINTAPADIKAHARALVEKAGRCASCGGDCDDANYCVGDDDE